MHTDPEIYFVVIAGIILGLLLVGFIVTILFLYQQSRHRQEREMAQIKQKYDEEILRSQLEIQENTMRTIAQELHDNIGQMLSVVKLTLAAETQPTDLIKHSQQVLNKAIGDLSDLTKSMHTDRINDVGLSESIRFELAAIRNTGLIMVNFESEGEEFPFAENKAVFIFRIFQELVNNTLKHAQATHVSVHLIFESNGTFVLEMSDDGLGFDVQAKINTHASGKGVGLKSIFNRAHLIGARLDMESEPGAGTRVKITLPATNQP